MATSLGHQLRRLATDWPTDPLRPTLQLRSLLASLADHPRLTQSAVQAARAIQQNAFASTLPVPDTILKPASMPHHYARLAEGYEKSLKGIGRPRWKIFFGVW